MKKSMNQKQNTKNSSSSSSSDETTTNEATSSILLISPPPPTTKPDDIEMTNTMDTIHGLLESIPAHLEAAAILNTPPPPPTTTSSSKSNNNHDKSSSSSKSSFKIHSHHFNRTSMNDSSLFLPCKNTFMIQSRHTNTTLTTSFTPSSSSSNVNTTISINGNGLSSNKERFTIQVHSTTTTKKSIPATSFINPSNYLHYGDVISIQSVLHSKTLGVRTVNVGNNNNNNNQSLASEVGFFRTLIGEAELWIIQSPYDYYNHHPQDNDDDGDDDYDHESDDDIDKKKKKQQKNSKSHILTYSNHKRQNTILRMGESILLYNVLHQSFLCIQEENEEKDNSTTTTTTTTTTPLIGIQKKSHGIHPNLIWTISCMYIPPLPQWSCSRRDERNIQRPFLDGTYLLYPKRNDDMNQVTTLCFQNVTKRGNSNSISKGTSNNKKYPLPTLDVTIQDSTLVDEILSCMIGLEGNYIRIVNNHTIIHNHEPTFQHSDENTSTHNLQNLQFGFVPFSTMGGEIDLNLRSLTEKVFPTCNAFVQVNAFVSNRIGAYEYGSVTHALCGAMEALIQEYLDFILSLEKRYRNDNNNNDNNNGGYSSTNGSLTMSKLWGEIQPAVRTMSVLSRVVGVVKPLKGGALLNKLEDLMEMHFKGDDRAKYLISFLLDKASVPYMDMLRGWLESGVFKDPFQEFMIERSSNSELEKASYSSARYEDEWAKWYILREEHVLNMMRAGNSHTPSKAGSNNTSDSQNVSLTDKILTTGKYWNAVGLCKLRDERAVVFPTSPRDVRLKGTPTLSYRMGSIDLSRYVQREYDLASKTFFNVIMRDYRILEILAFMKRYFLLDQGDFFVHFLDMAEDELLQEMSDVSHGRVQNWMSMSIQMSGGDIDGKQSDAPRNGSLYPDRPCLGIVSMLKCDFATQSLVNQLDSLHMNYGGITSPEPKTPSRHAYGGANKGLTGVEAFMLSFQQMPFPLSLILSPHTVTNYQLLFRHLFFAKHVERRLVGTWLDLQLIKDYASFRKDLGRTYSLRHRMLHFMQNFVYYMMFEVIEPNWLRMESEIVERCSIDTPCDNTAHSHTFGSNQSRTVDDILRIHNDFVLRILKECLLTNRDLIRTLTKLMTTCLLFSDQMKLFMETTQIDEEQNKQEIEERQRRARRMYKSIEDELDEDKIKKARQAFEASQQLKRSRRQEEINHLSRELSTESYKRMITRFEQVFHSNLSEFMSQLMSDSHMHLSNLCERLDYNGYVTQSMKG